MSAVGLVAEAERDDVDELGVLQVAAEDREVPGAAIVIRRPRRELVELQVRRPRLVAARRAGDAEQFVVLRIRDAVADVEAQRVGGEPGAIDLDALDGRLAGVALFS